MISLRTPQTFFLAPKFTLQSSQTFFFAQKIGLQSLQTFFWPNILVCELKNKNFGVKKESADLENKILAQKIGLRTLLGNFLGRKTSCFGKKGKNSPKILSAKFADLFFGPKKESANLENKFLEQKKGLRT